jgi:phenylacetic acid degradation operon negative regulatory protein
MVDIRPPRQYATEGLRTQTLLFTFIGHHVRPSVGRTPVATKTFLTLLDRLGVSVNAGRSTLTRMVGRGFLARTQIGRNAWYSTTDQLEDLLTEGGRRLFAPPVRTLPVDLWTLLSFSIPEEQRQNRHSLRAALGWNGFGALRDGLWIAPGEVAVAPLIERLGLEGNVDTFVARSVVPSDAAEIVQRAWRLDDVAERYHEFIERWRDGGPTDLSPLARQILAITEWQRMLVTDPQLTAAHLPEEWPSMEAFELFLATMTETHRTADMEFRSILETAPAPESR